MIEVKIENIPFSPDKHEQLENVGTLSHAELEQALAALLGRVRELETELSQAKSKGSQVQRFFTVLRAGDQILDLSLQDVSYTPGVNQLLVWGNDVKQYLGANYLELDETHVMLTDPASEGDTLEILILPVPFAFVQI